MHTPPITQAGMELTKATKGEVLKLYFSKFDHLLFKGRMDDLLIIFSISISILIAAFSALKIKLEELRRFYSLLIMTIISLLGPISWYVLASPHSYIHTHINYNGVPLYLGLHEFQPKPEE